jgi:regulator of protease activity HflC (stomatin/prohibitin superfamily)
MDEKEEERLKKVLARQSSAYFTVEEGKGKIVLRFGAFERGVISYKDHELDNQWNIVDAAGIGKGHGQGLIGGMHGKLPGAEKIYTYTKRWLTYHMDKGKKEVIPFAYEEILDSIPLQPTSYLLIVRDIETAPPEKWRVTVYFEITYQVINIYKPFFKAPFGYHEKVMELLNTACASWLSRKSVDRILIARKNPSLARQEIGRDPVILTLHDDWGIKVLEKVGIRIIDVKFPPELVEPLEKKRKLKLDAEAKKTQMEIESQARASEAVGTMIQMIHQNTGMPVKEIRKQLRDNPGDFFKKYKPILEKNYKLLADKIAIEGGAYVKIDVEGAQGIERTLLNLLTAWQRIPMGKKEKIEKTEKKEKTKKEDTGPRTGSRPDINKIVSDVIEKNTSKP